MKVCPTCNEVYKDDDINFCLSDGTTLLKKKGGKAKAHSHWNDVLAIILGAVAVLVLLCLITSSTDDRSLISTGAGLPKTRNWIGVVGANIAAVLFSTFGWTAYLIPLLIALIGFRVYQSDTLIPRASRVAGYLFFAVSLSGLITLLGGYGAIVGEAAAQGTAYFIGTIGAGILLTAVFASSLILITNLTLDSFVNAFGLAGENFKIRFEGWWSKRRQEDVAAAHNRAKQRGARREPEKVPDTIRILNRSEAVEIVDIAIPEFPQDSIPTLDKKGRHSTGNVGDETFDDDEDSFLEQSVISTPTAERPTPEGYQLPDTSLLTPASSRIEHDDSEFEKLKELIEKKAAEFNVPGTVPQFSPGPVVTTFEFKPNAGVKYSRVTGLVDDLSLALKAESIRIDRIPGKAHVGIEVPNRNREIIFLREVIESPEFARSESKLTLALGKTIDGKVKIADLAKMPHLLIAGATGAGKSVGVNTLVMSILLKAGPADVKFIMVDPKQVELGLYADIPHLATPIITDPKRAATALRWAVVEMEKRYKDLAKQSVRNIAGYNEKIAGFIAQERLDDNGDAYRKLPYIVIIIDELADLMMVSGKEVEESITRLAQMARAVGIHLILATQRPSVDVITGIIKANMPTRIAFRVSSKVDSRTIIDGNGAESLLGQGDMLFLPPGQSNVIRVHGAFVDEDEINGVVDFVRSQGGPEYDANITKTEEELDDSGDLPGRRDPLFMDALRCVVQAKRGIGYGRAAAILDAMVREGYIGEMDGSSRARPVLQKANDDAQDLSEMEHGSDPNI